MINMSYSLKNLINNETHLLRKLEQGLSNPQIDRIRVTVSGETCPNFAQDYSDIEKLKNIFYRIPFFIID